MAQSTIVVRHELRCHTAYWRHLCRSQHHGAKVRLYLHRQERLLQQAATQIGSLDLVRQAVRQPMFTHLARKELATNSAHQSRDAGRNLCRVISVRLRWLRWRRCS